MMHLSQKSLAKVWDWSQHRDQKDCPLAFAYEMACCAFGIICGSGSDSEMPLLLRLRKTWGIGAKSGKLSWEAYHSAMDHRDRIGRMILEVMKKERAIYLRTGVKVNAHPEISLAPDQPIAAASSLETPSASDIPRR